MFERFGSAAVGRIFAFEDRSGRRLALNADSLVVMLRALSTAGVLRSSGSTLASASVPIARYRRNGRRGWSQGVAVICNEPDERAADLSLLRLWTGLFAAMEEPPSLEYCDYAVFDLLAAEHNLSPQAARAVLHKRDGSPEFLLRLERLAAACRSASVEIALDRMVVAEPATAPRATYLRSIFAVARTVGVTVSFDLDFAHAAEYQAGLCFLVRAADGRMLGDGGGYHHLVRDQGLGVQTCWSTSVSITRMGELGPVPERECVHLLRLPDVTDREFLAAADLLRQGEYDVREHWRHQRLRKQLRRIPSRTSQWFALFGPRELAAGELTLQNAAVVDDHRSFRLNPWRSS
jgi:histidyl-tRNA synthetase